MFNSGNPRIRTLATASAGKHLPQFSWSDSAIIELHKALTGPARAFLLGEWIDGNGECQVRVEQVQPFPASLRPDQLMSVRDWQALNEEVKRLSRARLVGMCRIPCTDADGGTAADRKFLDKYGAFGLQCVAVVDLEDVANAASFAAARPPASLPPTTSLPQAGESALPEIGALAESNAGKTTAPKPLAEPTSGLPPEETAEQRHAAPTTELKSVPLPEPNLEDLPLADAVSETLPIPDFPDEQATRPAAKAAANAPEASPTQDGAIGSRGPTRAALASSNAGPVFPLRQPDSVGVSTAARSAHPVIALARSASVPSQAAPQQPQPVFAPLRPSSDAPSPLRPVPRKEAPTPSELRMADDALAASALPAAPLTPTGRDTPISAGPERVPVEQDPSLATSVYSPATATFEGAKRSETVGHPADPSVSAPAGAEEVCLAAAAYGSDAGTDGSTRDVLFPPSPVQLVAPEISAVTAGGSAVPNLPPPGAQAHAAAAGAGTADLTHLTSAFAADAGSRPLSDTARSLDAGPLLTKMAPKPVVGTPEVISQPMAPVPLSAGSLPAPVSQVETITPAQLFDSRIASLTAITEPVPLEIAPGPAKSHPQSYTSAVGTPKKSVVPKVVAGVAAVLVCGVGIWTFAGKTEGRKIAPPPPAPTPVQAVVAAPTVAPATESAKPNLPPPPQPVKAPIAKVTPTRVVARQPETAKAPASSDLRAKAPVSAAVDPAAAMRAKREAALRALDQ